MSSRTTDPGSPFGVAATVFGLTALPFGLVMGAIYGDITAGMVAGLLFGTLFGVAMIPFLRVERRTLSISDRPTFERRLKIEMSELGYSPTKVDEDILQFRPPSSPVLAIGPLKGAVGEGLSRVTVHFDERTATVVGPRQAVRKVVARVR